MSFNSHLSGLEWLTVSGRCGRIGCRTFYGFVDWHSVEPHVPFLRFLRFLWIDAIGGAALIRPCATCQRAGEG